MKKTEVRSRWCRMLSRCEDDDYFQWEDYGGRGIRVCDEWHDFHNFYNWCMEQGLEKHLQIDRIDNDGDYSPDNCRVVTRKQNARNKRNSKWIEAFEERKTLAEWAEDNRCAVTYATLARRIALEWNPELAISTPKNAKQRGPAHNAKFYEAFGDRKTLNEWSHDSRCVVGFKTLSYRVNQAGWNIDKALTQHLGPQGGTRR